MFGRNDDNAVVLDDIVEDRRGASKRTADSVCTCLSWSALSIIVVSKRVTLPSRDDGLEPDPSVNMEVSDDAREGGLEKVAFFKLGSCPIDKLPDE